MRLDAVIAKGAMPHNRDGKATSTPLVIFGDGATSNLLAEILPGGQTCRDQVQDLCSEGPSPAVKLQDVIVTITTNDESHSSILAISCRIENYNIYTCVYTVYVFVCDVTDLMRSIIVRHCAVYRFRRAQLPNVVGQTLHLQVTALRSVQVEVRRA